MVDEIGRPSGGRGQAPFALAGGGGGGGGVGTPLAPVLVETALERRRRRLGRRHYPKWRCHGNVQSG